MHKDFCKYELGTNSFSKFYFLKSARLHCWGAGGYIYGWCRGEVQMLKETEGAGGDCEEVELGERVVRGRRGSLNQ